MQRTRITLNDLARLDRQLRRDSEIPLRQLRERDRAIGAQLEAESARRRLLTWLDQVAPVERGPRRMGGLEASIGFWLAVSGALAGILAMGGLLLVDARQPVNVLLFLTLFIGTQLLLLLLTLAVGLSMAADSGLHLPFENLNPARLLFRRALHRLAGESHWEPMTGVVRLGLLRWGQLFGVTFNLGGLVAFLLILLATDRSFGWSSTLTISAGALHHAMDMLALPWARWMPEATVSFDLVQATRYQSLQTDFGPEQVAAMREWWPFLFACVVAYGLCPRFSLWLIFAISYRRQLNRTFIAYPGVGLVLDRMTGPVIDTRVDHAEQAPLTQGEATAVARLPGNSEITLIDWAGAMQQGAPGVFTQTGLQPKQVLAAGLDLKGDESLLRRVRHAEKLVIAVKGWEPPLGELADFIRELDRNTDCYLLLVPLPNRALEKNELLDWQHFARQLPQPRITIVRGDAGS